MLQFMSAGASPSGGASTQSQTAITDLFASKPRTFSAEVIPPRNGVETTKILQQIATLKSANIDFISVTKGAGGSLRGGTLPIAQLVLQQGMGSVAHFTCRDYTIEETENALMDHHYFGIRNILALRGDPPDGRPDHFKPAPNRHTFAYQVVQQIVALNRGQYLVREGYDKPENSAGFRPGTSTNFCIGVAAYPEDAPFEQAVKYFKLKVQAGAQFGITQMLFDADVYARFIDGCQKAGASIPVLPGIRVINNFAAAERMVKKFNVSVPQVLLDRLSRCTTKEDGTEAGLEFTVKLSESLLKAGAPGIHVFVMNDEHTGIRLIKALQ